ncbi:MAG: phosphodiester glycosidase family protein, partial [Gaiella sp.]
AALTAEATVGADVVVRLQLRPDWPSVVDAIGGGPQIVRGGAPVFSAGEEFTSLQLTPRAPRTAVGQTADGRVLLVAVDGRQPGLSVGLTNFELAQTLVRLGAVTGMALDGGGSTTMAFDGRLLNRPSDGVERPIATALVLAYTGVFLSEPPRRISPNGDGVDDSASIAVRVVRPSIVSVRVVAPGGVVVSDQTEERAPGVVSLALPASAVAPTTRLDRVAVAPPIGRWRVEATATDDLGRLTTMSRSVVVDDTLGFLRVPARHAVSATGPPLRIAFRLAREAQVRVTVLDAAGVVVRRHSSQRLGPGARVLTWDGRGALGRALASGRYTVRVAAVTAAGPSELDAPVALRVATPVGQ